MTRVCLELTKVASMVSCLGGRKTLGATHIFMPRCVAFNKMNFQIRPGETDARQKAFVKSVGVCAAGRALESGGEGAQDPLPVKGGSPAPSPESARGTGATAAVPAATAEDIGGDPETEVQNTSMSLPL